MPSVAVDGVELHFRDLGEGPPIVALHPGPGTDGAIFLPWLEPLAQAHRLLLLDLPGNGRSADAADRSLSGHARAARGFADALGLDDYTLLGHSFGSHVAMTQAVEHPGRAARLVVSCGAATESVFDGLHHAIAAFAADRPEVAAAFEAEGAASSEDELRAAWKGQMPFFCADPDGPACEALTGRLDRVRFRVDAAHAMEALGELELLEALPAIAVPALVIAGADDRITPPRASEAIAAAIPDAELVVIERAGHFPYAEQPEAYLAPLGSVL
jgi:pimeloyl-ACP methyl ester carboxylesterase